MRLSPCLPLFYCAGAPSPKHTAIGRPGLLHRTIVRSRPRAFPKSARNLASAHLLLGQPGYRNADQLRSHPAAACLRCRRRARIAGGRLFWLVALLSMQLHECATSSRAAGATIDGSNSSAICPHMDTALIVLASTGSTSSLDQLYSNTTFATAAYDGIVQTSEPPHLYSDLWHICTVIYGTSVWQWYREPLPRPPRARVCALVRAGGGHAARRHHRCRARRGYHAIDARFGVCFTPTPVRQYGAKYGNHGNPPPTCGEVINVPKFGTRTRSGADAHAQRRRRARALGTPSTRTL